MKIKTSELSGRALDWAVAKALGHEVKVRTWKDITDTLDPIEDADMIAFYKERNTVRVSAQQIPNGGWFPNPKYSTDWAQGGPIIQRELIAAIPEPDEERWGAYRFTDVGRFYAHGPNPLIAAMRCYVASVYGDEVDVPEGLMP